MYWVIQENLYNEVGFNTLIQALEAAKAPYSVHKVIPFIHNLDPDINPTGKVIVMGAYTMNKIAKDRGWTPGSYLNENFNYMKQVEMWPGHMLNEDASMGTFKNVEIDDAKDDDEFFIRPLDDGKAFAGEVMTYKAFKTWRYGTVELGLDKGYPLHGDTWVMLSPVKTIHSETRIWVVNTGKPSCVVTASTYKIGNRLSYNNVVDEDIVKFVEERNAQWKPDDAYVMDIARTPDGLKIVEVNNINSSGFYAGNIGKVVLALEELNKDT